MRFTSKPTVLLAASRFRLSSLHDSSSEVIQTIEMKLQSPKQPDVIRLDCGGKQDIPAYAVAPSKAEIITLLGNIATIVSVPESR